MAGDSVHPRVHGASWALLRYGELARRCFAALESCDPAADALVGWLAEDGRDWDLDAVWERPWSSRLDPGGTDPVPEPVAAFFASVASLPSWVDWRRIDRARRLFERAGVLGGLVLSLRSLMGGYTAPVGNKPLAFSGRLRERAPRRVAETARFVTAVCAPGGMHRGAPGFEISLRVRLMHAQVRHLLWRSGRWDRARWAEPINQHDMLATMLLFSEVYVEGLRIFGLEVSDEEAEDWIHLWRLVAWVMGTHDELLPRSYAEASTLRELIQRTQGPPDADSRALAAALIDVRQSLEGVDGVELRLLELRASMARGLSRMLIGDAIAEQLGIAPAPGWGRVLPIVPRVVAAGERLRLRLPALERSLRTAGAGYWSWVVDASLRGRPAEYARPDALASSRTTE